MSTGVILNSVPVSEPSSKAYDVPVVSREQQLARINQELNDKSPQEIIKWAVENVEGLYQTTAFGLSGLITTDILASLGASVELIFLDTLYHFKETYDLVRAVEEKYPQLKLHIYRPEGCSTTEDFENAHGKELWEENDFLYDYLVKVEPSDRAYKELGVKAVFTGRRRSQGAARSEMPIVEVTEDQIVKINPLANWSFGDVQSYIKAHNVPYNKLLEKGYRSVGDWHSTQPVKEGEDERAGRWKGKDKTECGIHVKNKFSTLRSGPIKEVNTV